MRTLNSRRENYSSEKKKPNGPSDFLQLMVEAQKQDFQDEDDLEKEDENEKDQDDLAEFERNTKIQNPTQTQGGKSIQITNMLIKANSLLFFIGGFDNTGQSDCRSKALLSVAAYHLAVNPEVQKRLQEEADRIVADYDGKVTYDGVVKMTYLDMIISECLRLYAPSTRYDRVVTREYTIPEIGDCPGLILPVGTVVVFPIMEFHKDPKYFPNPEKFDPERFSPENKAARHPYVCMHFGLGPRSCVAMRFVLTEVSAALAHLVHPFEIQPCAETTIPLKLQDRAGFHRPAAGLKLALVKRR